MKKNILKFLKNLLFQIIFFMILFGTVTFAAISWPSLTPIGEDSGGIFTQYFDNIKGDCPFGKVLEGFDDDFNKICKEVILVETCTVANGGGTKKYYGGTWSACEVTWCTTDYYKTSTSICSYVGIGYYSPYSNISRSSCINKPANSYYTSDGNGSNSCSYTCNSGYSGTSCLPIIQCGTDYYESTSGICSWVGKGYYSPNLNNSRYSCTNKPSNSYYISDGNGSNNCSYSCNSGYHLSSLQCLSNTISCYIANGTGQKTWDGSSWGECTVVSCDSGYIPGDPPPVVVTYTASFPGGSGSNCSNKVFSGLTTTFGSYSRKIKYYDHGWYTLRGSGTKAQGVTSISVRACIHQGGTGTFRLTLD